MTEPISSPVDSIRHSDLGLCDRPAARRVCSGLWQVSVLAALLYLTMPLGFLLLSSVADSTMIETPLTTGRVSLRWYQEFLADPRWIAGLVNSLTIAALTAILSLVAGLTAALAFERHRFHGRAFIGTLIMAPLFVPPVALGMQSLAFHQVIGLWGSQLSVVVAHALWATPMVFIVMRASLAALDPLLERAAVSLGAPPWRAFLLITLPQVVPGLVVAAGLAFVISVNEFLMAQFLATPRTQTLPTLIWPLVRSNLTPIVAAASGLTIVITLAVLLAASRLMNLGQALRGLR